MSMQSGKEADRMQALALLPAGHQVTAKGHAMKLKHQIPKHIYERGEELGKPDFYVGPTIDDEESRNGSNRAAHSDRDDDLQAMMDKTAEDAKEQPGGRRQSLVSFVFSWIFRGRLRRPRTAR